MIMEQYQQVPAHPRKPSPSKDPSTGPSAWRRIGVIASLSVVGGLPVVITCAGFLGFLWYGTADNHIWHRIVLSNWTTRHILPSCHDSKVLSWPVPRQN
ncbi:hypothetical protein V8C42DRAFT_306844 [Trichoderma barbatum]